MNLRLVPFSLMVIAAVLTSCGGEETALPVDAAAGKEIYQQGCGGCHTVDGTSRSGPSFLGLAGSQVTLKTGASVVADRNYLVNSILDPSAQVVDGYVDIMGSAVPKGTYTEEQADQLAAYIESLGEAK